MVSKHIYNNITWIDMQSPTQEEVLHLVNEYSIPSLVAEEFMSETVRSKVDLYDNLIYLILHFPVSRIVNPEKTEQEIDFVIGKDFLITIHYEHINSLHKFFKKFEKDNVFDKTEIATHAGYLFCHVIKELYKCVLTELENINQDLRKVEQGIFGGKERETVKVISDVNRKLLDFKQSMRFHYETLKSFESAGKKFFEPEFAYYLEGIISEYNKIKNVLDNHKDLLNDLRETNDSLLSSKTNEVMKNLTILNFIILPIGLIAGIFAINSKLVLTIGQFYNVIGIMVLISVLIFIFLKTKKWL
jgi:magnesium transporter